MEFRFRALSGTDVLLVVPEDDSPEAAGLIDAAASEIAREYAARRRVVGGSSDALKWLRPLAYQFISTCLDNDLQHLLHRRTLKNKHYARAGPASANYFQLGLMAIFAEDEFFVKEDRYELGQSLWYAYRHYCPPCFLNGFISQVGKINKDKADNQLEESFGDWIVERRLLDIRAHNPRGRYPRWIDDQVRRIRSSTGESLVHFFEAVERLNEQLEEGEVGVKPRSKRRRPRRMEKSNTDQSGS